MASRLAAAGFITRLSAIGLAAAGIAGLAKVAAAQTTVYYDNTTNYSGSGFAIGGATTNTPITAMALDDIQLANGGNADITTMMFSVADFNTSAAISASPIISIYNGTASGPTTLITTLEFSPVSFAAGADVSVFTYTSRDTIFTAPASGFFWAGTSFTSNTATVAQINLLGVGIFNPPSVGSSTDSFYLTSAPGVYAQDNPAGNLQYFGGAPVANFGYSFSSQAKGVPEPASAALVTAAIGFVGRIARRNRCRR